MLCALDSANSSRRSLGISRGRLPLDIGELLIAAVVRRIPATGATGLRITNGAIAAKLINQTGTAVMVLTTKDPSGL